ncbi:NADH-quinone oxidoreductase subunit [Trichinella spiralis]|uniref:NADH-quinone oxidoreductase subunit n=1 Tax=Trichinella spiralis TaxID=6334 RepID=A0ABR3K8X5_TRISP
MARVGLEPTTLALLAPRSNQLSYPATWFFNFYLSSFHWSLAKCCELTSFFKLQGLRVLGTRRPSSCSSAVAPKHLSNPSHLRRSCYTTNPTVEPDKKVSWAEAPLSKECCFGDSEVGHCLLLYERSVASYAMPFVFCPLFFGESVCRCGQLSEKVELENSFVKLMSVVPQSTKTYAI